MNLSPTSISLLIVGAIALSACDSSGTCELKYDEGSKDGSIPAGLAVCMNNWVAEKCSEPAMSGASMGLKTSGYTFTKGAKCDARGYKDCSGGLGTSFYKDCPK